MSWLKLVSQWVVVAGTVLLLTGVGARATGNACLNLTGTVRAGGHSEANAVVWLVSGAASPVCRPATKKVVLDQRDLAFHPTVLAVQVGTTVDMPNDDRVFHNVFSFHDGKRFDLGLYPVGTVKRVTFDQPGLSRIFCNIHQGMAAYVMAVPSPYFAVSDRAGRITIESIPAGRYTYHAWRPGRQEVTGSIFLTDPQATLEIQWP